LEIENKTLYTFTYLNLSLLIHNLDFSYAKDSFHVRKPDLRVSKLSLLIRNLDFSYAKNGFHIRKPDLRVNKLSFHIRKLSLLTCKPALQISFL
jgi:aspartyl-tRNA synthetase